MDGSRILDSLQIASPCHASWADMLGDDRARFCRECNKCVYSIAMMSAEEVVSLIKETEGRVCVRLYRRRDGTVITSDCPVGEETSMKGRFRRIVASVVIAVLAFACRSLLQSYTAGMEQPSSDWYQLCNRIGARLDQARAFWRVRSTSAPDVTEAVMGMMMPPVMTNSNLAQQNQTGRAID